MAYKLQLKRGASGSLPTGSAGEPLFTTDTNDLYIGTGAGNQKFQKFIASGTSAQFLKGDGSLDSTTYTPTSRTLSINGTSYDLSANRTWSVGTVTTAAATTGGQVAFFNGVTVITSVSGLYFDGVDKLGVGNSSPAYNLDITGTFRSTGNLTAASIIKSGGTSSQYLMADGSTSTLTNPVTGTGTTNYLPKWTSGSAIGNSNLINDASGNLGLGVVPSSWAGGIKSFEINPGNGLWSSTPSQIILNSNSIYTSGGFVYASSNASAYYSQFAGGHYWYTAPSGTAGNAITFTQAMTLTSAGNLLVGTTTDSGERLQVEGDAKIAGVVLSKVLTGNTAKISLTSGIFNSYISAVDGNRNMEFVNTSTIDLGDNISGIRFCTNNNTTTPALKLAITGAATFSSSVTATDYNLSALNTAPATASSTGTLGQIRIDANHIYVCTATNTWKRVAIATF